MTWTPGRRQKQKLRSKGKKRRNELAESSLQRPCLEESARKITILVVMKKVQKEFSKKKLKKMQHAAVFSGDLAQFDGQLLCAEELRANADHERLEHEKQRFAKGV